MKLIASCAMIAIVAGCNSSKPPSSSDTSVSLPAHSDSIQPISTSAPPASDCPHDGKWALCSIERRLKQSGYVVKRVEQDTVRRDGFSVKPTVYTLGRSRVEIFLYRDSASVARDCSEARHSYSWAGWKAEPVGRNSAGPDSFCEHCRGDSIRECRPDRANHARADCGSSSARITALVASAVSRA
jgi:hypothetical protein